MDNSKYFSNPKLKELAAIKGLYDSYYSLDYIPENISILNNIAKKVSEVFIKILHLTA